MNLLLKKLLCALTLVIVPLSMRSEEPQQLFMQDLSQEEQQMMYQELLLRKMIVEVLVDLLRTNIKSIDWLLENYLQQPEESTKKIMHLVELHSRHRWESILSTFAAELGITSKEDYTNFMQESAMILNQVIAPELEKWIYCSVNAGMMRK